MAMRCSLPDLRSALLGLTLVVISTSLSQASEEGFFEVAQPVETAGGFAVVHVTYASYTSVCCPSVLYTCRANTLGTDSGVQNRNLANRLGMRVTVAGNKLAELPDYMCDTLDVRLDLSGIAAHEKRYGTKGIDQIVKETVECIRENAGTCRPILKVLRLHVIGPERFRHLGGVFPVTAYRAGPVDY